MRFSRCSDRAPLRLARVLLVTWSMALAACGSSGDTASASPAPIKLVAPEDVVIRPDGKIYFSDFGGNRILELQPNAKLRLVAGTGKSDETGDNGPALAATLRGPAGLAVDRSGSLFIADHDGQHIRRIDPQGIINIAPGTSNIPFDFPIGLAFDDKGSLYVADEGDQKVRRIDSSGSVFEVDTSRVPGPHMTPRYLAFSAEGDLYVADGRAYGTSVGCRIVRVTSHGMVSVIAGTGQCGFSGDGGRATDGQLDDPNGLAFDSAGNLYFADSNNQRIRRIDRTGLITTVAGTGTAGSGGDNGPATKAELSSPFGIAMAPGDLLYIAEGDGKRVRLLNVTTGTITTVAA